MKKSLTALMGLLLVMLSSACHAADVKFDIYKSNQISASDLQPIVDLYKDEILQAKQDYDHQKYDKLSHVMKAFSDDIRKKLKSKNAKFAFINFNMVNYVKDPNAYITLNLLDLADKGELQKYSPKPKGRYKDPANLIKDWDAYQKTALPLYLSGKVSGGINDCHALHCLGSFDYPTLKHFETKFIAEVPKHQNELVDILRNDERPTYRASAAFLLAYTKDKNQLIQWLIPSLDDPGESVRNNAARIFLVLAANDPKITLPIEKFTAMLHSPVLTDRNKSLGVLSFLSHQPRYASLIKQESGTDLLDTLKLQQPDLHVFAYQILKQISGQQYGERDYAAWSHWLGLTQAMTLFRENALKAMESPELTHSVTTVVAPSAALGILAILLMLLAMAVWGWFANIPMAVQGSGMVVLRDDWQQALHENDVVQAMKREQLTRVTTLLEKKRAMYMNHELTEADLMAAESEVMHSKMALATPETPYALGASHPFSDSNAEPESAVALVLVNNQAAKQLSVGMKARVYPGNQMNNESAAVNAVVTQVTEYPVSKEIALSYLGNRAMVDALFSTGIPHLAVLQSANKLTPGSLITANVITHTCHPVQLLTQADCG